MLGLFKSDFIADLIELNLPVAFMAYWVDVLKFSTAQVVYVIAVVVELSSQIST